jgi:serine phosphatase RsbU (regulator of sigma subunit)/CTP:molybdopterin cytidylyltransferase MocA
MHHVVDRALEFLDRADVEGSVTVVTLDDPIGAAIPESIRSQERYGRLMHDGRMSVVLSGRPVAGGVVSILLEALKERSIAAGSVLVLLADVPLVSPEDLVRMSTIHEQAGHPGLALTTARRSTCDFPVLVADGATEDYPAIVRILERSNNESGRRQFVTAGAFLFDVRYLISALDGIMDPSTPETEIADLTGTPFAPLSEYANTQGRPLRAVFTDDGRRASEARVRQRMHLLEEQELSGPGLNGFVISRPCDESLGGDFYAINPRGDFQSGVLIGDLTGHGRDASEEMLSLLTAYRILAKESHSISHILERLRDVCSELDLTGTLLYFTVFVASKGDETRRLAAVTLGHPKLLVLRHEQDARTFPSVAWANGGYLGLPVIGNGVHALFAEDVTTIRRGDLIVAYSDGVSEAMNGAGEMFDEVRGIKNAIPPNLQSDGAPEQVARAIDHAVVEYTGGRFVDDRTVMALRVV